MDANATTPARPDESEARRRAEAVVEARWREIRLDWERRREAYGPRSDGLHDGTLAVLAAARAHPVLRGLFPYTSHWNVKLAGTTTFPYEAVVPLVMPLGGGRFRVMGGDPFGVIGETGSAEEAVALVAAHAPPGLRPATTGLPPAQG